MTCKTANTGRVGNHGSNVTKGGVSQNTPTFALYVDEKLQRLDDRTRMLTEKKITGITFDAEIDVISLSTHLNENQFTLQPSRPVEPSVPNTSTQYLSIVPPNTQHGCLKAKIFGN